MKRYPATAVIFEIKSKVGSGNDLPIGTHVEGAGPCCLETDLAWKCGVIMLNGEGEEESYQWAVNLKPLTKAARDMLALCDHRRSEWRRKRS